MKMSEEKRWDAFWKKYTEKHPEARALGTELCGYLKAAWKDSSPWMGEQVDSITNVDSNGELRGSAIDWIMMGLIPHFILQKVQEEFGPTIEEIKKSSGKPSIELAQAFAKAIEEIKGVKHEIYLTSSEERTLHLKIDEMLMKAEEEILIAAWIDTVSLDKIADARKRGIEFRIITHKPSGPKRVTEAFSRLLGLVGKDKIKLCPLLHNRMLVIDRKELLFGADLTSDSLETNYDAGIWTNNPLLINRLVKRFEEMWGDDRSTHPK